MLPFQRDHDDLVASGITFSLRAGSRTPNPLFRTQPLCPVELRGVVKAGNRTRTCVLTLTRRALLSVVSYPGELSIRPPIPLVQPAISRGQTVVIGAE